MTHRLTLFSIVTCLFILVGSASSQTVSKFVLSPIQPASLDYSEQVTVNFAYNNTTGKPVYIYAVPYSNGRRPTTVELQESPPYPDGSGSGSTWFTLTGGTYHIDEVKVLIVDKNMDVLYQTSISCDYYWPETSIFSLGMNPSSSGYYEPETKVNIDFHYFTDEAGGILVFAEPRCSGTPDPNAEMAPAILLPEGGGSGTSWFVIHEDSAWVNEIRFYVTNHDQTETLYEKTVAVDYNFVPNCFKSVYVDPLPTDLEIGDWVQVRFSYTCNWDDGALFTLDCLEDGLPSDKDTVTGGFTVEEGIGEDTLWFTYTEPGTVEQLRILMYDADSVDLACGFNINVSYDYVEAANEVTSITLMTPTPATVHMDDQVFVEFEYTASDPEGVRVLVMPWLEGGWSPHTNYTGSPVYPAGSGSGSQWFRATDCDTRVDEVHLRVMSADNSIIYQDTGVLVDYDFVGSDLTITKQAPASPATVQMGEEVMIHFDYETMCNSSFRVHISPMSYGSVCPGAEPGEAPYGWAPTGSDSVGFTVDEAGEVTVDQVRLQLRSLDSTELYDEHFFPVEYLFTEPTAVDITHRPGLPDQFSLAQNYPNPFNPGTTIEYDIARRSDVRIGVYNVLGELIRTLVSQRQRPGRYRVDWDGADEAGRQTSSGVYFYRIEAGDYVETRKMLLLK